MVSKHKCLETIFVGRTGELYLDILKVTINSPKLSKITQIIEANPNESTTLINSTRLYLDI